MTLSLTLVQGAYIVAGLLFILALAGLSRHETRPRRRPLRHGRHGHRPRRHDSRRDREGTRLAGGGRVTDRQRESGGSGWRSSLAAMVIGAAIGLDRARKVEMTGMPELIAMLHSFVGLAAVLVGWN